SNSDAVCRGADVAYWHLADFGRLRRCPLSGPLWGAKRHCPQALECPLMTHSRHRPVFHLAVARPPSDGERDPPFCLKLIRRRTSVIGLDAQLNVCASSKT